MSPIDCLGHNWQCTKWQGHVKQRGNKTHTAFAPSSWHPDFAIKFTGEPNMLTIEEERNAQ